ncbi:MAG: sulfotransferase, partial [Pseudomonadota bacterium]
MKRAKVFGIGLHKTGTSSLAKALKLLGYKVTGPNGTRDADIAETYIRNAAKISSRFDAFQDNPWPLLYRQMDAMWPGAKFILTTRDSEAWIVSQVKHFG